MDERFRIRVTNLHCQCGDLHDEPNIGPIHGVHVHGKIEVTIGGNIVDFGSDDICINDLAFGLGRMRDEVLGVHEGSQPPTIFRLYGRSGWPERAEIELNCMGHAVRAIVRRKGDIAGWCLMIPSDVEDRTTLCIWETCQDLKARYVDEQPIPWSEFFGIGGCGSFLLGRRKKEEDDDEPAIACERVVDFRVRPDAQSLEAACANCGASVWVRVEQLKPETPVVDWLLCRDCG